MLYEYCVIGNGPIGASIAAELAGKSGRVCLLGAGYGERNMYYSSHEDDSRIARTWHADPYWQELAGRNFSKMEALAADTDIEVLRPTQVLYRCASEAMPQNPAVRPRSRQESGGPDSCFELEDVRGGIIDPKLYVAALNRQAQDRGAEIIRGVAESICWKSGNALIHTAAGELQARRVVDARGILFQQGDRKIEAAIVGKILIYTESELHQQGGTFCFVDMRGPQGPFTDMYGIWSYRPGQTMAASKFGFTECDPILLNGPGEMSEWFQTGYGRYPYLEAARALLDNFYAGAPYQITIRPCAFVVTPDRRPAMIFEERYAAIAGCNGMAAKCCQALAEDFLGQWKMQA